MSELMERAKMDFDATDLDPEYWNAFWAGYLTSFLRFGG